MTDRISPGARIKALRKARHKLTADDVAAAVGVSRPHLSMIENDKDLPGRETLTAIADYFGVSVDYILNGGDAAPQTPRTREIIDDPDELAWLALWRSWTRDERRTVMNLLRPPADRH